MADIFVSWTSKNKAAVAPLVKELRNLGFDLFEYSDDMILGGDLVKAVQKAIREARLALICFDDSTYAEQWIISEVTWSVEAIDDPALPMKNLIPVLVGPHPDNKLPNLVAGRFGAFDLGDGSHRRVLDLAGRIVKSLPGETRHVVLGAIYAMNSEQFAELRKSNPTVAGLSFDTFLDEVCATLGMPNRPDLFDLLEKRYTAQPEDISPFQGGPRVIELVYDNLKRVNDARRKNGMKQLFVRWVREELNGALGQAERDTVAANWETGDSLLVLDSLSMWHEDVRNEFLAGMPEINNSSIVWIPPFTQKLNALFPRLSDSWGIVTRVRNQFMKWKEDPNRNVTCDAITDFALDRWFHRTFDQVEGRKSPLLGNLAEIQQSEPGTGLTPSRMF